MEQTLIPDTHAFVKEMTAAGMPEPIAEAFVTNYTKHLLGNLPTKQDIHESNQATKIDIANIQRDIEGLRKDTTTATESLRKDTTALVLAAKNELIREINNSQFKIIGLLAAFASLLFVLNKFF